jgi:tetratricopeptide (TPR) repeat protein
MYVDHYVLAKARREASLCAMSEELYASAYQALEKGDDDNAKRLFGVLAVMIPKDERPWIGLAVCSERKGEWSMAGAMYAMGSAFGGGSAWASFGRGRALKRMGNRREAERAFEVAESATSEATLLSAIEEERRNP